MSELTSSHLRTLEDLQRERSRPDLEKVFMNSLFGVGLVGVGYLAVKLGQTILYVQDSIETAGAAIEDVTTPGSVGRSTAKTLEDWVLGDKADVPVGKIPNSMARLEVRRLRAARDGGDKEAIAELVEKAEGPPQDQRVTETAKILGNLDRFYTRWGAILPVGIVAFNGAVELLRVRRVRGDDMR